MPLMSPRFASNKRLQAVARNAPSMKVGEQGEAVKIVQQAFMDLGWLMPKSTKKDGTPDGIFGAETAQVVQGFEAQNHLSIDAGIVGLEVMDKLDEFFPAPARDGALPRLINFDDLQERTIREDLNRAMPLTRACASSLVYDPRGRLSDRTVALLQDTFGIDGSDPDQVEPIRRSFANFTVRMVTVELIHTNRKAPDAHHMGYAAFVDFPNRGIRPFLNEIYVTDGFFKEHDPKERSCTLIHEYMHLVINHDGHAGTGDTYIRERTRMGVPFDDAVNNPYCYDRYACWL